MCLDERRAACCSEGWLLQRAGFAPRQRSLERGKLDRYLRPYGSASSCASRCKCKRMSALGYQKGCGCECLVTSETHAPNGNAGRGRPAQRSECLLSLHIHG